LLEETNPIEIEISKHLLNIIDEYVYYQYKEKYELCIDNLHKMFCQCADCDTSLIDCNDECKLSKMYSLSTVVKRCGWCDCYLCPQCKILDDEYYGYKDMGGWYLCKNCDDD
jgi:hypothetical protein